MELQNDAFFRVEQIFKMYIQSNPHLDLWSTSCDASSLRHQLLRRFSIAVSHEKLGQKGLDALGRRMGQLLRKGFAKRCFLPRRADLRTAHPVQPAPTSLVNLSEYRCRNDLNSGRALAHLAVFIKSLRP